MPMKVLVMTMALEGVQEGSTGKCICKNETSVADPGCLSRIPDPTFFHPGSRIRTVSIPDPGSSSKNLSILTPKKAKKMVSKL
jgi:hypothetical protein